MIIEKPSGGGNFEPTPEGQHNAICCRIVDYGTHTSTGMYAGKQQRKLLVVWEIPDQTIEWEDRDGKKQSGPVLHSERYTWSFDERSNLRKMLESWRGKKFTDDDFEGPNAFDMRNLIGVPATIQITHDTKGDKTYANLQAIMRSPYPREQWPSLTTDPIFFDLRQFDQGEFDKLSEYWQGLIKTTPEWSQLFGEQPSDGYQPQSEDPSGGLREDDLEDVPF